MCALVTGLQTCSSDLTIPWDVRSVEDLSVERFSPVLETEPPIEIMLLGCGNRMQLLSATLRRALRSAGLSLDVMNTGAACRTFNVLMSEDRRAAAALIAIAES